MERITSRYEMTPTSTTPIPVRLDDATRKRTKRAASQLGVSASGVVRLALLLALDQIESGQQLRIPRPR